MKAKFKIMIFVALIPIFVSTPSCLKKMDHSGNISSVAFSPDGKILASGSKDFGIENDFIKLWDVKTGEEIKTLRGHSNSVTSIDFSPDGEILASGSNDSYIKLWDVKTGEEIKTLQGHSRGVTSIDFSPDGEILASGGRDGQIKLWDIKTGDERRTLKAHSHEVTSIDFSPDGEILASGSKDSSIKLWDVKTGEEIINLQGHSRGVTSIDFSPDGEILASGGKEIISNGEETIKLWNVKSGNKIEAFWAHFGNVYSISFSPDGEILASGGEGRSVKLWNVKMCEEIKSLRVNYSSGVASLAFSPEGKILASASGKFIRFCNIRENKFREIITNLKKFYHEDFKADIFSLKGTRWFRFQSDENQIYVNEKNELELNFDKTNWIGAYYVFPQYLANGVYEFTMLARAEKQNGRASIYDFTANKVIFLTKINISKEYKECFFRVKMPEEKDHSVWLYFHQHDDEETGGKLFIKKLRIFSRHISKD